MAAFAASKKSTKSQVVGKKRKRSEPTSSSTGISRNAEDKTIQELEQEVQESRKHYNNITILQSLAYSKKSIRVSSSDARLALCRVFCRLIAEGSMSPANHASPSEKTISEWLNSRYKTLTQCLVKEMVMEDSEDGIVCLNLLMQLVKHEVAGLGTSSWTEGLFSAVLRSLTRRRTSNNVAILNHFVEAYVQKYHDVRYYTTALLGYVVTLMCLGRER